MHPERLPITPQPNGEANQPDIDLSPTVIPRTPESGVIDVQTLTEAVQAGVIGALQNQAAQAEQARAQAAAAEQARALAAEAHATQNARARADRAAAIRAQQPGSLVGMEASLPPQPLIVAPAPTTTHDQGQRSYIKGTAATTVGGKVASGHGFIGSTAEAKALIEPVRPSTQIEITEQLATSRQALETTRGGLVQALRRRKLGRLVTKAELAAQDADIEAEAVASVLHARPTNPALRPQTRKQEKFARQVVRRTGELKKAQHRNNRLEYTVGNWDDADGKKRAVARDPSTGLPIIAPSGKQIRTNDLGTPAQTDRVLNKNRYTPKEVGLEALAARKHKKNHRTINYERQMLQHTLEGRGPSSQKAKAKVAAAEKVAAKIQKTETRLVRREIGRDSPAQATGVSTPDLSTVSPTKRRRKNRYGLLDKLDTWVDHRLNQRINSKDERAVQELSKLLERSRREAAARAVAPAVELFDHETAAHPKYIE